MNRKKKINETLKQKAKKANAKLHSSNKPKYVSKAERAAQAIAAETEMTQPIEQSTELVANENA
ncbi:conserved hypothetical protein [Shewanella sp. ANA-3]|uniref:DUF2986 domain-containing protein n=1 Tax=Shewanella sp. (strain ANA-3) TaxID=94122 RepID=UPI00005E0DCA|nr:DUF2986 domain-containing protein [Shewanella sp. ANA-3]ABK46530.1 conserved hypothetical protein [Shewanella sp. ANA-3]